MKTHLALLGLLIATALAFAGCAAPGNKSGAVAEGVIFSVEYQMEGGRTGGFTRLNDPKAVPGGSGSWNVDARGRLTTKTKLVLAIGATLLVGAVVLPQLVPPKIVRSQTSCVANLRMIDGAKMEDAQEHSLTNGSVVTKEQLLPYFGRDGWPQCPKGGEYSISQIGVSPKCSYPEHRHYEVPRD